MSWALFQQSLLSKWLLSLIKNLAEEKEQVTTALICTAILILRSDENYRMEHRMAFLAVVRCWSTELLILAGQSGKSEAKLHSSIESYDQSMNASLFYKHALVHTQVLFQVSWLCQISWQLLPRISANLALQPYIWTIYILKRTYAFSLGRGIDADNTGKCT